MEIIKYWWKAVVWYPLDIADRILVLVGAVAGFLQKGDNPVTVNLAWQIPVGAIALFLIWRLMQAPVKIRDDLRRASRGEYPLTLEGISQQIKKVEDTLEKLQGKIDPQYTFDFEEIKERIFLDYKTTDYSLIGGITRAIVFVFEVMNASPVCVNFTGKTKGDLIVEAWKLMGVSWQIASSEIEPAKKGQLRIVFPVSETFVRTLAFKPQVGYFSAEFSEMLVEFEAIDNQQKQTLGYIPIGKRYDIPIKDHPAFQKIRKIVEWEEQLGKDDRITR